MAPPVQPEAAAPANKGAAAISRVCAAVLSTFFPALPAEAAAARAAGDERRAAFLEADAGAEPACVAAFVDLVEHSTQIPERSEFKMLMRLLDTKAGTLALAGPAALKGGTPRSFPELAPAEREALILKWQAGKMPKLQQAAKGFKSLSLLAAFRFSRDASGANPFWEGAGYGGPPVPRPRVAPAKLASEAALTSRLVDLVGDGIADAESAKRALAAKGLAARDGAAPGEVVVDADAVVVGSGAGGGVAAGVLARAGLKVVVLEKGRYVKAEDLPLTEAHGITHMYERGGVYSTRDLAINVLAGAAVGGGTRINWCASFPTPDHVRAEWATQHGLPDVAGERFDRALAAVCSRTGVGTAVAHHSNHNACLGAGLEALGEHRGEIPRNCSNSKDCGVCCLGCPSGERGDMTHTFLADAAAAGAVVVAGALAERVLTQKAADPAAAGGRKKVAVGVLATPMGASPIPKEQKERARGAAWRLVVRAPVVVAAAGSMHTPGLLMRSKISGGGWVGKNLRLHPATIVFGRFPAGFQGQGAPPSGALPGGAGEAPRAESAIRMWEGAIMSTFSKEKADWDGTGYGPMLMTPSLHVGGFAATSPWRGGKAFKTFMSQYPDWSSVLVITRDRDSGKIYLDKYGQPRYKYWGSAFDRASMTEGIVQAVRALVAAGAVEVGSFMSLPHLTVDRDAEGKVANPGAVESYVAAIRKAGIKKNRTAVLSAHQMGTARIGGDRTTSAADPDGQLWDCAGLYVADASAFPTSSGINPMMTIEAIGYMVAEGIAARAGKAVPPLSAGALAPGVGCASILASSFAGGKPPVRAPVGVQFEA